MKFRTLFLLPILLSPVAALAQDAETCEILNRRLNNGTQVIGNTQEVRSFVQSLSLVNADVRKLRIELRRSGCGVGSIVVLGGSNQAACEGIRADLDALESERDELVARRNDARRMVRPSGDRTAIIAAIRQNGCEIGTGAQLQGATGPSETQPSLPGIELPGAEKPYSGITDLRSKPTPPAARQEAAAPVIATPPDRPYDTSKKVRSVGPQFLPEPGMDLANPADHGVQQTQ
jgi:hypothetical protein